MKATEAPGGGGEQAPSFLTIKQCAVEVAVSPWVIWKACRLGYLPSVRIGTKPNSGVYRVTRGAWEKWKASRVVRPFRPVGLAGIDGEGAPLIDRIMGARPRARGRSGRG